MTLLLLTMAASIAEAKHVKNSFIQNVNDQQWLKARDEAREMDLERERGLGLIHKHNGEWFIFISPALPALMISGVLVLYLCYLTYSKRGARYRFD